jgi:hypothetical protein
MQTMKYELRGFKRCSRLEGPASHRPRSINVSHTRVQWVVARSHDSNWAFVLTFEGWKWDLCVVFPWAARISLMVMFFFYEKAGEIHEAGNFCCSAGA